MSDVASNRCPLCESEASVKLIEAGRWTSVVCSKCLRFSVSKRALAMLSSLQLSDAAAIKAELSRISQGCPDTEDLEVFTEPNPAGASEIRHRLRRAR